MGVTAVEKILARVIGRSDLKPGEIIYPEPDLVIMHDGHAHKFLRELWDMGVKELWHPLKVCRTRLTVSWSPWGSRFCHLPKWLPNLSMMAIRCALIS